MRLRYQKKQKGTAAVELAIICMMAITIIPFIFLFGRVFWHYNVLKQAAFDAARYVASAHASKMIANSADVTSKATALVADAVAVAGMDPGVDVMTLCLPTYICSQTSGGTIKVVVAATLTDPGFAPFNAMFLDYEEFRITATAEVPYASRLPTF